VVVLSVSETVAQDAPDKTLVRVQGRSYVDIEGLAQAIGVTFGPNQIRLTIPAPAPRTKEAVSKEFQQMVCPL